MDNDEIELLEMLGSFAGEQPVTAELPLSTELEEVYEPEATVPPQNTKPAAEADELPALLKVLRGLPAEQRAEALEIANALGVGPGADDILYSVLVGLGYHKTLLAGVPDQIAQAGEQAKNAFVDSGSQVKAEIVAALEEGAGSVLQAGQQACTQFKKIAEASAAQIQIAAGKGAQNAVSAMDITPIVEAAISKIASKTESALAKKWFSRAVIISSISAVVIAGGAGYSGYKIAGLFNAGHGNYSSGDFYLNQLQCSAAANGVIPCRDQFGNLVKFRSK